MTFRTKDELVPEGLRRYIEDLRSRYGLAGIGMAVVEAPKDSNSDWQSQIHCVGHVAADGRPFEPDSLFPIASNSKLICAVVLGLLIHRKTPLPTGGELAWRTKIKTVLDWKLYDKWAEEHLDIVDLFTMRSGLPRHDMLVAPGSTAADIIPLLEFCKPSDEPRKTFQYNNIHYALLSLFPQKLLGISYEQFVKENIFDPLGMKNSNFDHQTSSRSPKAVRGFYRKNLDKERLQREMMESSSSEMTRRKWSEEGAEFNWFTPGAGSAFAGAGGAITTLEDATRWMRELLDPKIIPKEVLEKLSEPLVALPDSHPHPIMSHSTYALGQWQTNYRGFKTIQHTGGMSGYGSYIVRIPGQGLACAIFMNDAEFYHPLYQVIGRRWMDKVLGLTPHEWECWEMKEMWKVPKEAEEEVPREDGEVVDIRGIYDSKAYPKLVIKPFKESSLDLETVCRQSQLAGHKLNFDGPVYVADLDCLMTSHVVFAPLKGTIWNWMHIFTLPRSERGAEAPGEEPFEVGSKGKAVFVPPGEGDQGGLAMFDGWIGSIEAGIEKRKVCTGLEAKERCEMWYDRHI